MSETAPKSADEPNPHDRPSKVASGGSRQVILLLLRVLVAAAGIGYIILSLTWHDQVILASGQTLSDGRTLSEATAFPVVEGDVLIKGVSVDLSIDIDGDGTAAPMPISEASLDPDAAIQASPGILTMIKQAKISYMVIALLLVGLIFPLQTLRWNMLMRARGLECSLWKTFRLTMAGMFFNLCMPGLTGGDVVKAYYAAKRSDRRPDAVMSVIFDRVTGLISLVLLGGVAGLFMLSNPIARGVTAVIWLGFFAGLAFAAIFFNVPLRNRSGLSWFLRKLPAQTILRKLDDAAVSYMRHKKTVVAAVAITLPGQIATVTSTALTGYALGMDEPFILLMTVVPVLILGGAVPLTYQGLGVMEAIGMGMLSSPFNQVAGMLLFFRLYQIAYALIGSYWVLRGDIHLHPEQDDPPDAEAGDETKSEPDSDSTTGSTSNSMVSA